MTSFARRLLLVSCCGALSIFVACDDEDGSPDDEDQDHQHESDAAHDHDEDGGALEEDYDAEAFEEAPCTPDYPEYSEGMSVTAGAYKVQMVSVTPTPPRQKMRNDWVFKVVDASGAPVTGLAISTASSYMPVHMHPGRMKPKVMLLAEPAQAMLDDIDFSMPGPWQVRFLMSVGGGPDQLTTIPICVK